MSNIQTYLQQILDAVYGEEVRGSIHDAIATMNSDLENAIRDDLNPLAFKGNLGESGGTNNNLNNLVATDQRGIWRLLGGTTYTNVPSDFVNSKQAYLIMYAFGTSGSTATVIKQEIHYFSDSGANANISWSRVYISGEWQPWHKNVDNTLSLEGAAADAKTVGDMKGSLDSNLTNIFSVDLGYISNSGLFFKDDNYICTGYIPLSFIKNILNIRQSEDYPLHIHFYSSSHEHLRTLALTTTYAYPAVPVNGGEYYARVWTKASSLEEFTEYVSFDWIMDTYGDSFPPYWVNGFISNSGDYFYDSRYIVSSYIYTGFINSIYAKKQTGLYMECYDESYNHIKRLTILPETLCFSMLPENCRYVRLWFLESDPKKYSDSIDIVYGTSSRLTGIIDDLSGLSNSHCEKYSNYESGKVFRTDHEAIEGWGNYGLFTVEGVKRYSKLILTGYSEVMTTFGYGIYDTNGSLLAKGGVGNNFEIIIPDNASYVYISIKEADKSSIRIDGVYKTKNELDEIQKNQGLLNELSAFNNVKCEEYSYYESGIVFRTDQESIAGWNGYGLFTIKNIYGFNKLILTGYSEAMTTFGYGIYDTNGSLLAKGGVGNNVTINVPVNASYAYISAKDSDKSDIQITGVFRLTDEVIKIKNKMSSGYGDVVVIGDSWSDTDSQHTSYIKWPVIFENNIHCSMHVYAQNGSSFNGETPSYQQNGNVKGQTQQAINDYSYDHENVDLIIAMGGVNDFRQGYSVEDTVSAFISRISEMTSEFTNARVVVFLNNQIYISDTQWNFVQKVKEGIKKGIGVPVFSMIGWVPSSNYISDLVHVDNTGYKMLAANVIACCFGGSPTYVQNDASYSIEKSGISYSLQIKELFSDSTYSQSIKLIAPSGSNTSEELVLSVNSSDHKLIGMLTNYGASHLADIKGLSSLSDVKNSYYQTTELTEDANNRGLTGEIVIRTGGSSGTYVGSTVTN